MISRVCILFLLLAMAPPLASAQVAQAELRGTVLDESGAALPGAAITATHTDKHPTDLAMLRGARLVTASETEEGRADLLYAPYVERQQREWSAVQQDSFVWIPKSFEYSLVPGLSTEMVERLAVAAPETLDQASRVRGVTPAALSALYVAINRRAAA